MNLLDRAIGLVAPGAALRRAQARVAMAMLTRSYEGARIGRRTEGWVVAGTSANAEIGTAIARLRDRTRDLVRNNPYAAKAVSAVVSNLVGTGIMPRARSGDGAINEMADRLWARFAEACDADSLTDFSGLQALIVRTLVESGECLVRIRERRVEDGLAVPLQLQLLEPDHLDASKTGEAPGGGFLIQGVEFDALGRRRAYWLYPVHPGEVAMVRKASLVSQPVPASSVLHLFDRLRPGQVRGVPWFAPVILKLRDLDDYDDAELVRKKIEACFSARWRMPVSRRRSMTMASDDLRPAWVLKRKTLVGPPSPYGHGSYTLERVLRRQQVTGTAAAGASGVWQLGAILAACGLMIGLLRLFYQCGKDAIVNRPGFGGGSHS